MPTQGWVAAIFDKCVQACTTNVRGPIPSLLTFHLIYGLRHPPCLCMKELADRDKIRGEVYRRQGCGWRCFVGY